MQKFVVSRRRTSSQKQRPSLAAAADLRKKEIRKQKAKAEITTKMQIIGDQRGNAFPKDEAPAWSLAQET
jgi:hypothetical protein